MQRMGDQMLCQSAREHCEMMEALTGTTEKYMEEMRVSRELEKEGMDNMCSLFREAIGTIKDMPMRLQHLREVTHTQVAPRATVDIPIPSTSRASHQGWMGVEGQ